MFLTGIIRDQKETLIPCFMPTHYLLSSTDSPAGFICNPKNPMLERQLYHLSNFPEADA